MVQKTENKRIKKIGILGGTFNPIHYGHLISAQWSLERFSLDKVLFIPTGSPPHKQEKEIMAASHRYHMTLLAIKNQANFLISTIELTRRGPSYTIDTIRELQGRHKENTQLYFITGADSIIELHTWKRYEELLRACYWIATTREGYDKNIFHNRVKEFQKKYGSKILELEIPGIGISSTELRNRIRMGNSIKYLVPEKVEQYITKHKLYAAGV